MKKNILKLIILGFILITITACGKEPITGADFEKESKDYGMEITDTVSTSEGIKDVKYKKAKKAVGKEWTAYFYKLSSEEKAISIMEDLKNEMSDLGKQKKHYERLYRYEETDPIITKDGYGKGVDMSTSAKIYKEAIRVEDTIIYIETIPLTFETEDSIPNQIGGYVSVLGYDN